MSYDGIPSQIAIDGMVYQIALDSGLKEDGEYSARDCRIKLRPDMAAAFAKGILVHEWLHGLYEHAGLTADDKPKDEETIVTALAYRLLESIRANPELIAFLTAP